MVWSASVSVAEEIEGRTALTVLSKPINRRQFVLGKFAGLILVVLLLFLILGSVLMFTTSLKVVYDAREGAKLDPTWRDCADEMITVVPGLVLSLFEAILLAAVSLAVSTRLGMVANLIICFTVYAAGHLVPLIVQSSVGKFAIVRFVGQLFATILPVLEHFTIEAAVVGGIPVPWSYLAWAAALRWSLFNRGNSRGTCSVSRSGSCVSFGWLATTVLNSCDTNEFSTRVLD